VGSSKRQPKTSGHFENLAADKQPDAKSVKNLRKTVQFHRPTSNTSTAVN
jgi:hypothetical protein